MLCDPGFVTIDRTDRGDDILRRLRRRSGFFFSQPQVPGKTAQLPCNPFAPGPALFRAGADLETASSFAARLLGCVQDRFVILQLRFQGFDLCLECVGLGNPALQLFVLRIHDELRFGAIRSQILEMVTQLRGGLFEIRNLARLMIHDFLDPSAIG